MEVRSAFDVEFSAGLSDELNSQFSAYYVSQTVFYHDRLPLLRAVKETVLWENLSQIIIHQQRRYRLVLECLGTKLYTAYGPTEGYD